MVASMPDLTTSNDTELIAIPGTPPDLLHPPKGDAFARRSLPMYKDALGHRRFHLHLLFLSFDLRT
jgi:ABC-type dipeptide/oligopeptide/nickel transport system ATPase component